jgi:hypothetical protein
MACLPPHTHVASALARPQEAAVILGLKSWGSWLILGAVIFAALDEQLLRDWRWTVPAAATVVGTILLVVDRLGPEREYSDE